MDTAILAACNMFRAAATYLIQQRGTEYFLDEVEAAIAEQPHRSTAIWEAAKRRVLRAALVILTVVPTAHLRGRCTYSVSIKTR